MINHLFQSLDSTLARFPNSGIILMGDFNKFNPGPLISSFDLKQIDAWDKHSRQNLRFNFQVL